MGTGHDNTTNDTTGPTGETTAPLQIRPPVGWCPSDRAGQVLLQTIVAVHDRRYRRPPTNAHAA